MKQRWYDDPGGLVSCWHLRYSADADEDDERARRIHATRCHSEVEGLRVVLRHCRTNQLQPDSPEIEEYFDSRSWFFTREEFGDMSHQLVLGSVLATLEGGYSDEIATIEWTRQSIRRSMEVKLGRLQARLEAVPPSASAPLIYITNNEGEVTVNSDDNSITVSGSTVGAVSGGSQNSQDVGNIEQKVAYGTDVTSILEQLTAALVKLRPTLGEEAVTEAEDIVTAVRDEVAKEAPDRGRVGRLVARLGEWASTVGEVAAPILAVTAALASALGLG